jgi:hypothetical protein
MEAASRLGVRVGHGHGARRGQRAEGVQSRPRRGRSAPSWPTSAPTHVREPVVAGRCTHHLREPPTRPQGRVHHAARVRALGAGRIDGQGRRSARRRATIRNPDATCVWISGMENSAKCFRISGEPGGNRTPNPQIKSLLLCQLSYRPGETSILPQGRRLRARRSGGQESPAPHSVRIPAGSSPTTAIRARGCRSDARRRTRRSIHPR